MRINIDTTPVNITSELDLNGSARYAIQNRAVSASLYVGWSSAEASTETGLELPAGAVYELPASLAAAGGQLWASADAEALDVRIIRVG
jgi:hypothetical protein